MNCVILSAQRSLSVSACRRASYIGKKKNYYEVLGVTSTASAEEIKRAFVKKSNQLHPDRGGKQENADRRVGWSRESSTEKFMQVKEAYDCLRRADRRRAYDENFIRSEGFLMEATSSKFRRDTTIVDLNKQRNESYVGPGKRSSPSAAHFRDPEYEYERERSKNRSLYLLGAIFVSAVVANIAYVSYLQRNKSPLNR